MKSVAVGLLAGGLSLCSPGIKKFLSSCVALGWVVLLLAGCGGGGGGGAGSGTAPPRPVNTINISGSAAIENATLAGALITVGKLDITQTSDGTTHRGKIVSVDIGNFQPVIAADGSFSFQLGNDVLQNEMLYSLSIDCTPKPTGSCPLQVPLHALISGERLKQGKFTINILTEVIHQRLGYYIAVGFNAVDLKQEMDAIATMLLDKGQNQNDEADYEDILNWAPLNPNSATAKRSSAISEISERLSEHGYAEKLQLDIQKLFSPIAETISTPNPAIQPAIQTVTDGSLLYVLNGSTLTAFDISKPLLPTFAGGIDVPGTLDMKLSGSYIYASYRTQEVGGEFGLKIIDVSDPANIYLRKNFPLESPAYGIYVSGSLAYVVNKPLDAQKPSQLLSIDISNPDHPSVEKSIKLGNFDGQIDACDVTIHNGLAYLTNRSAQLLHVVDLSSETAQPQNAVATSPRPCDIAAQGKYAYIATEYTGVEIFDLSNAGKPNSVKNILTQSLSSRIALSDSDIYIASAESGLQVFDISN
ncbi:MAG TPA: hypothetical protein VM553_07145, partial [Dongiaceae bacterium]|nr:hypothetical protein [Dongiaceae bacterium]